MTTAGAGPAPEGTPVEEMSYTDASAELDRIVRFFEEREVDVDQLVARLMRATAIIEELDKRLRQTRMQVEQLVPRLTAVLAETEDQRTGPAPSPSDPSPSDPPPSAQPAEGDVDDSAAGAPGAGTRLF